MANDNETWIVYLHTIPKEITRFNYDKYYVGITRRTVEQRWGKNGYGYKGQPFYDAILKYGWNNIQHNILYENLKEEDAYQLEKDLIIFYRSFIKDRGYNISPGGYNGGGNSKNIIQYTLNGDFVQIFPSLTAACNAVHLKTITSIRNACDNPSRSAGGFMWKSYVENYPLKIDPIKETIKKEILQFDITGKFIKEWNSISEACEHYNTVSIQAACSGKNKTAVGYIWGYKDKIKIDNLGNYVCPSYHVEKKHSDKNIPSKVFVYTLDGKFISEFDDLKQAKNSLRINKKIYLSHLCKDICRNASYGYRWCDIYYDKLPPLSKRKTNIQDPVVQIDILTNSIINIYPNACFAAKELNKTNASSSIRKCVKGKDPSYCTAYGYKWKSIQDISPNEITDSNLLEKYDYYLEFVNKRKAKKEGGKNVNN